ncbi:MAG: hypothetical protein SynsKO_15860 [Synoicihabitans sp.]
MSFHWPHLFWVLILPAALLLAELTRRVRATSVRHPKIMRAEASPQGLSLNRSKQTIAAMPRVRWRLWVGLALVVTAFARPQWGEIEEPVFEQSREILIGVDLSKSMLAADVAPTRLERAKLLITGLLEQLEGERVGLAVFAGTSFLQSPLSADYEILEEFLPALDPSFLPAGGTEYAALLDTALDSFSADSSADRFLIILSDGESQTEAWRSRLEDLKDRNIRVISLGIGTAEGSMLPDEQGGFIKDERGAVVLSRLNPTTLEELARETSGVYRDASAWVDLAEVVDQTVAAGLAGEFAESRRARKIERFQWALGPALLMLLWSLWREFPVRPRQRAVTIGRRQSATVAGALILGGLVYPESSHLQAQTEMAPPSPEEIALQFEAPLNELITRLATQQEVAAHEFAQVAEETIAWGNQVLQTGQPVSPPVVNDALEAVDLGEVIDPDAADWPTLREELEKLLEESEQQQQDQPQNDSDEDQQEESEDSEGGEDQNEGEEGDQENEDQSGEQDQEQDGEGDSQDSESGEGDESEQDNSSEQQSSDQEEPSQEERENAQNAFDDFDDPESEPEEEQESPQPEPQPQQPPQNTQSVGGQSVQNQEAEQNPELVVPLQKLDQLKDQDSPAQLFQLMQDPNAQPPKSGRDW